jgi:GAF domain-containing protein
MDVDEKRRSYEAAIRKIITAWELTTDSVARMAMAAAYLTQRSDDTIWAGFFLLVDGELTVGPYNGPPALPVLPKHEGVCWLCVDSGKPVIVPNTHEFEGHIRRAGPSNSEISVPIINAKGKAIGVLHHDSADFNVFDEIDVEYLTQIAKMVEEVL